MRFRFVVDVEVRYERGKFASRDDLEQKLSDEIESANPVQVDGDEGGEYTVDDWSVAAELPPKPVRRCRTKAAKGAPSA